MTVAINGKGENYEGTRRDRLRRSSRHWQNGDVIDVRLPMRLGPSRCQATRALSRVFYGPVLLAGDLGAEGLASIDTIRHDVSRARRSCRR